LDFLENISLKPYHTFGMEVKARYFAELGSDQDIATFYNSLTPDQFPVLILGRGSNVLFMEDYPGTVGCIRSKGIVTLMEDDYHTYLKVAAGELWDDVVKYAVDHGLGGIENLSYIPGTAGAAPVQNIGAYGVEVKDVIYSVEVADIAARHYRAFRPADCQFGYRTSLFKTQGKDRLVITSICLKLDKIPVLKPGYGDIHIELANNRVNNPSIADVRDAVINIRSRKLPDPSITGNAGSFFKNPVISIDQHADLKSRHPDVVSFVQGQRYKVAGACMIEQCGWNGLRAGDAGVHPHQPLVLVNYGNASGEDIRALSQIIRQSVSDRFGIDLEVEVNII